MSAEAPPPVLEGARVIAYAIVDDTVRWTGRQKLFHGDEPVGAVPRLAICLPLAGDLQDFLLFHCDASWSVLAVSGTPTLAATKEMAEHAYAGIDTRWMASDITLDQAHAWLAAQVDQDTAPRCRFCAAGPADGRRFVVFKDASICETCIAQFHRGLHAADANGDRPARDNPA